MLAAQFMVVLDVSVVNVALPSIGADLHLRSSAYQWTVSAYVLLSGGLLLLGGRMADLFDRRRMFLLGLTLFTGASLASGLAGLRDRARRLPRRAGRRRRPAHPGRACPWS